MKYTIEQLESIVIETKKSFLFFGEYLTQNKKELDKKEYDVGNQLMQLLLIHINSYDKVLKLSVEKGFVDESHHTLIDGSLESLTSINKRIHKEYGDIEFK